MLRRVILGVVLLLVAGVVLIGAVFTVSVVASGCRLFSVDEREFVAANRAILDELPVFPGAARVFSSSNGWPASNRCFAFENGPRACRTTAVRRSGTGSAKPFSA